MSLSGVTDEPSTEEIVALLDDSAKRLNETVNRAVALHTTFTTLNKSLSENEYEVIGPLAGTMNFIQTSFLREMILIIVRVLDKPRNLNSNDKVSFEVVNQWLEKDDVRDVVVANARDRHGEKWSRPNQIRTKLGIRQLKRTLRRLKDEEPNRERLLRDFRNDFLAHELRHAVPNDLPEFGHLMNMICEIKALAFHTLFVCTGHEIGFDHIEAEAQSGAEQLWRAISERQFQWHPDQGLLPG